jgi:primosomal protein N' (replication factor Y) (superfamily II helicase)
LLDTLMPEIEKLKQAKKVRWSLDIDPVDLY